MRILVLDRFGSVGDHDYPFVVLRRDNWDDYGFKTLFGAELRLGPDRVLDLGGVKILRLAQERGESTNLPSSALRRLPNDFCSLGQDFSYYEMLNGIEPAVRDDFLLCMRDIVRDQTLSEPFQSNPGFEDSLLRFDTARRALEDGARLLSGRQVAEAGLSLVFSTSVGGSTFPISMEFGLDGGVLPDRVVAVIGYNGSGKTQLLAQLAMVATADRKRRNRKSFVRMHGQFVSDEQPAFGSVVAISYSAFDTFPIPGGPGDVSSMVEDEGELFGHVYCGLRRFDADTSDASTSLKSPEEIREDFRRALERGFGRDRSEQLRDALAPLFREPSLVEVVPQQDNLNPASLLDLFDNASTGHKIVLNIVVQLIAHLRPNSLVLVDEPESHLHPPLLAALFRSISVALEAFSSYAVIATHSPVVLQEVPAKYVRVLSRYENSTEVSTPEIETFGENVGLLTRMVFSLDSSATDYQGVLRHLVYDLQMSEPEVIALFGGEMSAQARGVLASLVANGPGLG